MVDYHDAEISKKDENGPTSLKKVSTKVLEKKLL